MGVELVAVCGFAAESLVVEPDFATPPGFVVDD